MKKNINTLREHLFDTLQQLKEGKIDAAQAKVVSEVSQTIINSVKVELDFIKQTGGTGTNFITPEVEDVPAEAVKLLEEASPKKNTPVPSVKQERVLAAKEGVKYEAKPVKHKSVPNPVLVEDGPKEPIVRPKSQYSNRGYLTLLDEYAPAN